MERKLSSNYYIFVSILFFLIAWKLAAVAETGDAYWLVPAAIISLAGLLTGIEGVISVVLQPSPFHSKAGRLFWALRPRGWLMAWAAIMLINMIWGFPHILFQYSPRACVYIGWQGAVKLPSDGDGSFDGCRLFKAISQGMAQEHAGKQ